MNSEVELFIKINIFNVYLQLIEVNFNKEVLTFKF